MVRLEWAQAEGVRDYNRAQTTRMLQLTRGARGQDLPGMRVWDMRASWAVDGRSLRVGIVLPTFLEFGDVLFYASFFFFLQF